MTNHDKKISKNKEKIRKQAVISLKDSVQKLIKAIDDKKAEKKAISVSAQ